MDDTKLFFIYLAGVPVLGAIAHWLAWRLRLPSILLLLLFGIILGRFVDPDAFLARLANSDASFAPKVLFPIVSLSVAVILFAGGLSLRLSELREAGRAVVQLCTIGALVTWVMTWALVQVLFNFDARIAALFGAIMVVTGPTVVIPLLRHIQPSRRVGSTLKWEGIVVDPIGAVLAVLVFQVISESGMQATAGVLAASLARTLGAGIFLGLGGGYLLAEVLRRYWLPDHLQGVMFLAVTLGLFAASNIYQAESGLVTVTLLGIYLANQKKAPIRHVIEFKEHLVMLLIACLFIVLASRLAPRDLTGFGWRGVAFLAVMIFVIRPASVFLSMIGTDLNWRERLFAAFVAPRGVVAAAVTSVFSLEVIHLAEAHSESPLLATLAEQAQQMAPLAFLLIVGTVAIYGLTAGPLARWLSLAVDRPQGLLLVGAGPWVREMASVLHEEGLPIVLVDTDFRNVAEARMKGLTAHPGSILSDSVFDELNLNGVGRLLALTSNDEVNSLACIESAHTFGRANVFQLQPVRTNTRSLRETVSEHLRGRLLFREGAFHDELTARFAAGHRLKKTKITKEFTLDHFRQTYGESALLMFLRTETGEWKIATVDSPLKPKSGETVFSLAKAAEQGTP